VSKPYSIVILPDIQVPYHDKRFVNALVDFVDDYRPDEVGQIGDLIDAPEPSRWNKGMAGEFAPTLQASINDTHNVMRLFRNVFDGPMWIKAGNHDERVETYVRRYAPALTSLNALSMPELLRLSDLEIRWESGMFDVAPGWVAAHGHEGSLNRVAGSTALGLARRIGKSVVCGHTHRVGMQHESTGWAGKVTTITGLEVGHAMAMGKASYLKTGGANWQQGFGILTVHNGKTHAQAIKVTNRSFAVDGNVYSF
jgi:hypothetical protein